MTITTLSLALLMMAVVVTCTEERGESGWKVGLSEVPRVSLEGRVVRGRTLAKQYQTPVVLTETAVDGWGAAAWSLEDLSELAGPVHVRVKSRPAAEPPHFFTGCCAGDYMDVRELIDEMIEEAVEDRETRRYFSGPLSSLGGAVAAGIPVSERKPWHVTRRDTGGQIWIGSQGVTTLLHYDALHNFYAQIVGRKRFLLMSPEAWAALAVHPKHHLQHRNTLARLTVDDELSLGTILAAHPELLPHAEAGSLLVATLAPGEVLYLPPCWFHQVTAVDDSVSINIQSGAAAVHALDALWESPLPLAAQPQTTGGWWAAAVAVANTLLDRVYTDAEENTRVRAAIRAQYAPVAGPAHGDTRWSAGSTAHVLPVFWDPRNPDLAAYDAYMAESAVIGGHEASCPSRKAIHGVRIDQGALARVVDVFQGAPAGVREMYVSQWLDDMLTSAAGIDGVHALLHCVLSLHEARPSLPPQSGA